MLRINFVLIIVFFTVVTFRCIAIGLDLRRELHESSFCDLWFLLRSSVRHYDLQNNEIHQLRAQDFLFTSPMASLQVPREGCWFLSSKWTHTHLESESWSAMKCSRILNRSSALSFTYVVVYSVAGLSTSRDVYGEHWHISHTSFWNWGTGNVANAVDTKSSATPSELGSFALALILVLLFLPALPPVETITTAFIEFVPFEAPQRILCQQQYFKNWAPLNWKPFQLSPHQAHFVTQPKITFVVILKILLSLTIFQLVFS